MSKGDLNIDKVINYWKDSSDRDFQTMSNLLNSGDYNWAMFLGHLVIEKLLKAIYVKVNKKHAVHGHDLLRLSSGLGLELDQVKEEIFDRLTTFNLNARYDSYKQDFYQLCTKQFAIEWSSKIEELREWLLSQL